MFEVNVQVKSEGIKQYKKFGFDWLKVTLAVRRVKGILFHQYFKKEFYRFRAVRRRCIAQKRNDTRDFKSSTRFTVWYELFHMHEKLLTLQADHPGALRDSFPMLIGLLDRGDTNHFQPQWAYHTRKKKEIDLRKQDNFHDEVEMRRPDTSRTWIKMLPNCAKLPCVMLVLSAVCVRARLSHKMKWRVW